jgi:hypothetical protein
VEGLGDNGYAFMVQYPFAGLSRTCREAGPGKRGRERERERTTTSKVGSDHDEWLCSSCPGQRATVIWQGFNESAFEGTLGL